MKGLKTLLAIALSTAGLGTAVTLGVVANNEKMQEASAYTNGEVIYYLTGKFGGVTHWTDYIACPSDGNNAAVLLNQSLTAGDLLKFKLKGSWDNALTFDSFYANAGAYSCFYWNNGDDNTYVGATGTYNFYIWSDNGTMKVSVEFADNYSATYSYILTSNSTYSNIYMYNGGQKQQDWGSAPSVNGQAYDVKLSYSSYDYYGLYRIDDRVLKNWPSFILKNSDQQTGNLSRTAGNTKEVYFYHGTSLTTKIASSDEYKAVEFLYNVVSHRGSASYNGNTYLYSICATSPTDASAFVTSYDGFSSSIVSILNNASVRTYDLSKAYSEDNKTFVAISDVVDALRIVASRGQGNGSRYVLNIKNGETNVIVIVALVITLSATGAFFLLRKKRKEQ